MRIHVAAARETGLPLIIHARAADDDMARILSEEMKNGAYSCVMHCFSSSAELARAALDLGFYLSMSGNRRLPQKQELRDILLPPRWSGSCWKPMRPIWRRRPTAASATNPPTLPLPARVGAEVFGMDYAAFAAQTQANFDRLFWKAAAFEAAA